jgi:hypothetical protein
VVFTALFCSFTTPAFDSDFWWHLAFGRWMVEHGEVLRADPFDCTSAIFGASSQTRYQLTQYWLSQVLLYGAYLLAGLKGVVLLRAAVFTALSALLYRLVRRTGAGTLLSVLLLSLAVQAIARDLANVAARPQMWSSLFFVALLSILAELREGRRWARFALPPFMLLWANLHGGYILGVFVIVIAAAAAQLSRHAERRWILLVAVASIAATGCNPAGFAALISYPLTRVSGAAPPAYGIFEEEPLFKYVRVSSLPRVMPWLTAVFLLTFLTLLPRARTLLRERRDLLLLCLLTLGMGLKAKRFLVFFVLMACWLTAVNVAALRERLRQARRWPFDRAMPPVARRALTGAALVSLAAGYALVAAQSSVFQPGVEYRHTTEGAADFLERSGFRGNIFNEYGAGGYLAWRLHPEAKVFIYGRMVYPGLLTLYQEVVNNPIQMVALGSSGAVQELYRKVFDEYAINAVIFPAGDLETGDALPLGLRLARDDAWALVYARPEALVFLRKTPELAAFAQHALPKSAIYDNQIAVALAASRSRHGVSSPIWRRSLVLGYYGLGRKREALAALDEYLALMPNDTNARQLRDRIAGELGGNPR